MEARAESLFQQILAEVKAGTPIDDFAACYRKFQAELERLVGGRALSERGKAQSTQFMTQLLPYIHSHMRRFPRGSSFSILDIGPGTGNGSELLGALYAAKGIGYGATVTTLDVRNALLDYIKVFCPHVTPTIGNLFDLRTPYDIVIASHVLEHVEKPEAFARQMQLISRGIVVICAPYQEPAEKLSRAHRNIFDEAFLNALKPQTCDIVASPAWGQFMDKSDNYRMFIAVLPGTAKRRREPPPQQEAR